MPLPDNEQVNIEFVIAVEDFPVLYNYNHKDYTNRNEQDRAWRRLSEQFGASDMECKLRWRNLRNSFLRYMRTKNTTGSAARKPYYLWDRLQYILPYVKTRVPKTIYEVVQTQSLANNLEEELDDSNIQDNLQGENPSADDDVILLPSPCSSPSSCRVRSEKKINPLEKAITTYFEKKGARPIDPVANADLNFLTSLLPDLTSLPPRKKRTFKRKVLELLEVLSEDEPSSPSSRDNANTSTPPPSTALSTKPTCPSPAAAGGDRRPPAAAEGNV